MLPEITQLVFEPWFPRVPQFGRFLSTTVLSAWALTHLPLFIFPTMIPAKPSSQGPRVPFRPCVT